MGGHYQMNYSKADLIIDTLDPDVEQCCQCKKPIRQQQPHYHVDGKTFCIDCEEFVFSIYSVKPACPK